jgi:hypothetical protein
MQGVRKGWLEVPWVLATERVRSHATIDNPENTLTEVRNIPYSQLQSPLAGVGITGGRLGPRQFRARSYPL